MMAYNEVSGEAAYYTVIHTSLCKLYNVHRVQLYDIQHFAANCRPMKEPVPSFVTLRPFSSL